MYVGCWREAWPLEPRLHLLDDGAVVHVALLGHTGEPLSLICMLAAGFFTEGKHVVHPEECACKARECRRVRRAMPVQSLVDPLVNLDHPVLVPRVSLL